MSELFNSVKRTGLAIAEFITPVLKESKFKETGVLTPEEFVIAGDHLVHHCPTWRWATGDPSRVKSYLPKDKQFLVTKNVPCYKRCKEMECTDNYEKVINFGDDDEPWVDTHHYMASNDSKINEILELKDEMKNLKCGPSGDESKTDDNDDDDDDDEIGDMDEYMASGLLDKDDQVSLHTHEFLFHILIFFLSP